MKGIKDVSSPSFLPSSHPAEFQQIPTPSENFSSRSTIECLQEPEIGIGKDLQAVILYALEAKVIPFEYFGWDSLRFRWSFCLIITSSCEELKEKIATKLGVYYRPGYIDLNESEIDIPKIKAVLEEVLGICRDVV